MKKLVNYLGIKATIALFFVLAMFALIFGSIFYDEVLSNHKVVSRYDVHNYEVEDNTLEWTNLGDYDSDKKEEWVQIDIASKLGNGTYKVIQTAEDNDKDNQRVYSLYTSDLDSSESKEVTDYSRATTVGGSNEYEAEIEIIYDDYLYIKKAKGGDVGNLKLIKIED